jgi:hypothetical protein
MTRRTAISNGAATAPLTVNVAEACDLSGFGPTTIWKLIKDGRLKVVRVPGIRRTPISYASLAQLLEPPPELAAPPRRRGRPRKPPASEASS